MGESLTIHLIIEYLAANASFAYVRRIRYTTGCRTFEGQGVFQADQYYVTIS
ncbi:uncharacterized protein LAESUDRAFT_732776 [Laetiporus sulphureus 93-53]|uniref:Uncharacterized protein n=1 Tax=Laetiporus sulphureus 93-53 TaxID=1314785 RepID=A0A165AZA4_9APHY|nr:uncharacterized protein LAESUDRAFT_732776 [Laetiporus sulphureus 93-53]KZS99935.1 hypothetical protein LAESUDRAFT_732776 [Laetiporus sulphureus 93-53]